MDNPLLRDPLKLKYVQPRLLGQWSTTLDLNFIYVCFNSVIITPMPIHLANYVQQETSLRERSCA